MRTYEEEAILTALSRTLLDALRASLEAGEPVQVTLIVDPDMVTGAAVETGSGMKTTTEPRRIDL